jgi:hypothetical protein
VECSGGDTSAAAPRGGGLRRVCGQRGRGHQRESVEEPAERGSGVVARTAGVVFGSPRRGQVRRYTRVRPWRVERAVQGRAIRRLSVLPMPPTELADGFGREAALPAPERNSGAGFTPVLRWVPGSPPTPEVWQVIRRRPLGLPGWGRDDRRTGPRYPALCSRDNQQPQIRRVMPVAETSFDGRRVYVPTIHDRPSRPSDRSRACARLPPEFRPRRPRWFGRCPRPAGSRMASSATSRSPS